MELLKVFSAFESKIILLPSDDYSKELEQSEESEWQKWSKWPKT